MIRPTAFAVVLTAGTLSTCGLPAQTPAPAPAPPTFWNRLGIPSQPLAGIRNRGGNFPELERKPGLKPIADPANLASADPAIKKAAEIKAQEDLAPQKIKAIKYLAEVGCGGCYKDVDKALADALDDCTEAVRYEAVQAILAASACGQDECVRKGVRQTKTCKESMSDCWVGCMKRTCAMMHMLRGKAGPDGVTLKSRLPGYGCGTEGDCPGQKCACGDGNCCTSEILNKLSTMAYEKDDRGCWKEPSPRVRSMARQALRACGPNIRPMTAGDIPVPEEVPLNIEVVPPVPSPAKSNDFKPEQREEFKPEKREELKLEPRTEGTSEAVGPAPESTLFAGGVSVDEAVTRVMSSGSLTTDSIAGSSQVAQLPCDPIELTVTEPAPGESWQHNPLRQAAAGQRPTLTTEAPRQGAHPTPQSHVAHGKTPAVQSGNRVASKNGWRWPWEDLRAR